MRMTYNTLPERWMEGLPIGNGRLAAMVWGDAAGDTLTLNHEWLWRGIYRDRQAAPAAQYLPEVRELLSQGKYGRATVFANLYWAGGGDPIGERGRVDAYQPAGTLRFFPLGGQFMRRSLDIREGIARSQWKSGEAIIQGTFLAGCTQDVFLAGWQAQAGAAFGGRLVFERVEDPGAKHKIVYAADGFRFDCAFEGGIAYGVQCALRTDGRAQAGADGIAIEGASYIHCAFNIGTSLKGIDTELAAESLFPKDFDEAVQAHREAFAARMDSISFTLAGDEALEEMTLGERLARFKAGEADNGICTLYYHYGRYLMLSSSLLGDLPANLQGKWNDRIDPPWNSDYHMDINLQMNYWMIEPCGMTGCMEALVRFLESFYDSGREVAQKLYGCRGLYLPLQTDAWGIATPESFGWAAWIGAAPWMAWHLWQHYAYTGDEEFLRRRAYPFFAAVAEFYEDYLVEDEEGMLQIMPSQSPENRFEGTGMLPVSIGISAAMDVQLCYDALTYAMEAAQALEVDARRAAKWKAMRDRLPPFAIGADGRLLEWNEEKVEAEPGHRHLSHLYGVYPSALFTARTRPEQYRAARASLEYRLAHGGGHTGWSRAWVACLMARFGEGEAFYEHFAALIGEFATVSLLDLHPPGIFQIDGNFGAVAAVNEALVRCVDREIHLLPALPAQWGEGAFRGVRTPGGHSLDIRWQGGRLIYAAITLGFDGSASVRYGEESFAVAGRAGETVVIKE